MSPCFTRPNKSQNASEMTMQVLNCFGLRGRPRNLYRRDAPDRFELAQFRERLRWHFAVNLHNGQSAVELIGAADPISSRRIVTVWR